jgi:hypothetical protein
MELESKLLGSENENKTEKYTGSAKPPQDKINKRAQRIETIKRLQGVIGDATSKLAR